MTPELLMLALSVMLGFVHVIASAIATTNEYGLKWNMSARDAPMPPLGRIAGRLQRAQQAMRVIRAPFARVVRP